ncbi:hypothetical protein [Terriglobus roseus]|uniref:Uncharacterized protein n=1 Tax=Terriglobus roseus TaxID=392734 RepID=A0A1H4PHX8_9BACT|nr:hypothetical protein [Terriglobus roseus]SEC06989.1 hypothetical protein SAMN05443244_2568 [Terriglobus roseus]
MNEDDKNLETVLRGLREVQPDASLETRIARVLREAQAEPVAVPWFGGWLLALRITGAGVACIFLAAIVLRSSHHPRTSHVAHTAPLVQQKALPQRAIASAGRTKLRGRVAVPGMQPTVSASRVETNMTSQQQSFPAPPLPLTEQEKLLIKLAHRDDPVQLARLAPGPRAARYQAEKDQVSEFFTPPAPLDQPDMTLESGGGTQ